MTLILFISGSDYFAAGRVKIHVARMLFSLAPGFRLVTELICWQLSMNDSISILDGKMKKKAVPAPLHPLDSETQTYGCRHAHPEFCAKNRLPKVCAFVRADKICSAPPASWVKQFQILNAERSGAGP